MALSNCTAFKKIFERNENSPNVNNKVLFAVYPLSDSSYERKNYFQLGKEQQQQKENHKTKPQNEFYKVSFLLLE